MALPDEIRRKLREAREQSLASGISKEEAHADLPILPPIPTQDGETVVVGVRRKTPEGEHEDEQPESPD